MNINENWKYITKYRNGLKDYYDDYDFEWFCSLDLPTSDNIRYPEDYLKEWRCKMCVEDHIQISYLGVLNQYPHPHIHLLMFGRNKSGESLFQRDERKWENEWSRVTKRSGVIKPCKDTGTIGYTVYKNTLVGKSELITPYNVRLLKRYRRNQ